MTQLSGQMVQKNLRRRIDRGVFILRRYLSCYWERFMMCSLGKPIPYRMLSHPIVDTAVAVAPSSHNSHHHLHNHHLDSDLVALKISLLGDCDTGKTSFLEKYVGNEKEQGGAPSEGLNLVDKTLLVQGARISYSIWEVEGDENSKNNIPVACKDSVAILFMFDLTSRCTLKSVIKWYQQARKWNQTAIPILVGTKFDDFIQLPINLQWTIARQARTYAKALNAPLFFSSATYNINVNKIFKFITAKLFDIPWALDRNLTIEKYTIRYETYDSCNYFLSSDKDGKLKCKTLKPGKDASYNIVVRKYS